MTMTILFSCSLVALFSAVVQDVQDGARPVDVHYDVQALALLDAERPGRGVDLRPFLESSQIYSMEPDGYDPPRELPPVLADPWLAELVLDCLGEEVATSVTCEEFVPGALLVNADEAQHARIRQVLVDVEAYASRRVRVEVHEFAPGALGEDHPLVLTRAEVDRLLGEVRPSATTCFASRPGRTCYGGARLVTTAVVDYDVEVAKGAATGDPIVTTIEHGASFGAVVDECADGSLILRAWGRLGVLGDSETVVLDSLGSAPLELPRVTSCLAVGSAPIENGGGVVLGQGWNDLGTWVVRATVTGAELPDAVLPLGPQVLAPQLAMPVHLSVGCPTGGPMEEDDDVYAALAERSTPELRDLVDRLYDTREQLGLGGHIAMVGHALYVTDEALRTSLRRVLAAWDEVVDLGAVELELRAGTLAFEEASALVSGRTTAAELAQGLPERARGVARYGDSLVLAGGREAAYLQDQDVEIVDDVAIADPIVERTFLGGSIWASASPTRSGGHALWIQFERALAVEPAREWRTTTWSPATSDETGTARGGLALTEALGLPRTRSHRMRSVLAVEDDAWTLLGCEEVPGQEGRHFVAIVRVRRVARPAEGR